MLFLVLPQKQSKHFFFITINFLCSLRDYLGGVPIQFWLMS